MKNFVLLIMVSSATLTLSYCSSSKKASGAPVITYTDDVQPLVSAKCTPCHIPSEGGKKLALDNYTATSKYIDDIIRRIELNPGEKGFMPFKHEKLSDSAINVFRNWRSAGTPEKAK